MRSVLFSVLLMLGGAVQAATYVYVSNAEDGNIGMYMMEADGSLTPGNRHDAGGKPVMPMSVSPDKRFLVAGVVPHARSSQCRTQVRIVDRDDCAQTGLLVRAIDDLFVFPFFKFLKQ